MITSAQYEVSVIRVWCRVCFLNYGVFPPRVLGFRFYADARESLFNRGCYCRDFGRKEIKELQGKEIALKKAAAKGSKAEQKAKKKSAEDEVRSMSCK